MSILLTNIQRFSLHDGPGIRTTVFLKGCSLRCPWCSNPENLVSQPQDYIKDGIPGKYGKYYETDALVHECLKDKNFYEGKLQSPDQWAIQDASDIEKLPGGVTFSGGECLLQMESLVSVCEALHSSNIHIVAATCLFVPQASLQFALNHIDFFYVDVKILNSDRCKEAEKGNLDLYLENLGTFFNWTDAGGRHKPVVIRIPVIGTYTDTDENRRAVHDILDKYKHNILKIELIKEHNLGESKYKSLNMKMDYHGVEDSLMEQYKNELNDLGTLTEICRI